MASGKTGKWGTALVPWPLKIPVSFSRKAAIIVVGIANMDSKKIAHNEYPVNTIIIHEDFNNYSMSNNLALLKTDTAMHFDDLVRSICFLDRKLSMSPVLENCWVSGWNPTSAVNAILLLEEAVCVLAVGVIWMNHFWAI
jgi:hypothetical protein